jgi:hypothetical protein
MDPMESEFLTTKDVAKLLRCSVQALHNNRFGGSGTGRTWDDPSCGLGNSNCSR